MRLKAIEERLALGEERPEDSVHKAARAIAAKELGKLDALVDRHLGRRIDVEQDLARGDPEDVAVDGGYLVDGPLGGNVLDDIIEQRQVSLNLANEASRIGLRALWHLRAEQSVVEGDNEVVSRHIVFEKCLQDRDSGPAPGFQRASPSALGLVDGGDLHILYVDIHIQNRHTDHIFDRSGHLSLGFPPEII